MQKNSLSSVEVPSGFEACGLEDVRVIDQPTLAAPRLLTRESEPHQDAEVRQCAE